MSQVLFFDDVCNLCNSLVNFIIRHDSKGVFKFASIQSKHGREIINLTGNLRKTPDSIVLLKDGKQLYKSEAILSVLKELGGGMRLLSHLLSVFPRGMSDFVYDIIAKNRYRLFGKRKACVIPAKEIRQRFLDADPEISQEK